MPKGMTNKKNEITRELQQSGLSRLAQHQKESGFGIPEGYFESFSQSVRQKIEAEKQPVLVSQGKYFSLRTAISMAASFLVLIGLSISFFILREGKEEGFLADYDDNIFDEYFARVTDFDRGMLYELILDTDVAEFPETRHVYGAEDDFIVEYLLEATQYYGIEPTELITQNDIDNQH
jgi:hypothetical protein